MSIKTIHCRLTAPEPVRRHLWHLMSESNTPLVNQLLKLVSQHAEFETWQRNGTVSVKAIRELCKPLRDLYPNQPGRFYDSASLMVAYTYESWLALQKKRHARLMGKKRWLDIVKSDAELVELSGSPLTAVHSQAEMILNRIQAELNTGVAHNTTSQVKRKSITKKRQGKLTSHTGLINQLFSAYASTTDDVLSRCAIAYLIKNNGELPIEAEKPDSFAHRVHRKHKEIEGLEAQLQARLPKGRDLTGEAFLNALAIATETLPESPEQTRDWQNKLLARPASLPYPILYGSAVDIRWGTTAQGRITVSFNGVDKFLKGIDPELNEWFKVHKQYPFRVHCDQRQLPFFQRFLEDWNAYQAQKESYPASLLTLSSAILGWREGQGKGDPWTVNHLVLYCSFDTRLMTAEGTLQVQHEKIAKTQKNLSPKSSKPTLTSNQKKFHQRSASTLKRLQNIPPRPSRPSYQGNPEIIVGLSIGLTEPVTVAVVNVRTGTVLTYRTPKTLLGENYRLLNRHRRQQQQHAIQRHKNQKRGLAYQPSESELGQYVDRLLAKAMIQLAQQYNAGSIVLPRLTHRRELLASEIAARAEQKCPGSVEIQARYAKQYQQAIHRWSYHRLLNAIQCQAEQLGLTVESGFQPMIGSTKEQARDLAIAAYHSRAIASV